MPEIARERAALLAELCEDVRLLRSTSALGAVVLKPIAADVDRAVRLLEAPQLHGVTFLIVCGGFVLLEKCPRKREVLGVGEWFVPGGKIEPGESPEHAMVREAHEELGITVRSARSLPVVEGSPVPPGPRGLFLMRPFHVIDFDGEIPAATLDGNTPLAWVPIEEALLSPVPQVRMMAGFVARPAVITYTERDVDLCLSQAAMVRDSYASRNVDRTPDYESAAEDLAEASEWDALARKIATELGPGFELEKQCDRCTDGFDCTGDPCKACNGTGLWPVDIAEPAAPRQPEDDPKVTRNLLLIAGMEPDRLSLEDVQAWAPEQRRLVDDWASRLHVAANDHDDVEVPPMPDFLPADLLAWTPDSAAGFNAAQFDADNAEEG